MQHHLGTWEILMFLENVNRQEGQLACDKGLGDSDRLLALLI